MKKLKFLETSKKSKRFLGAFDFGSNFILHDEFFRARLRALSQSESRSILILGPSGSGKSVLAFEIWKLAKDDARPFVNVPCRSIKDSKDLLSLFKRAEGGDLYLKHLHDLPVDLFPYLQPLIKTMSSVRVLASSFEEISGLECFSSLSVPPLSKRKDDIQKFVSSFLSRRSRVAISTHAMDHLLKQEWKSEYAQLADCILKCLWFASVEHRVCITKDDVLKSLSFPNIDFLPFEIFMEPAVRESLTRKGIKTFLQDLEVFAIAMGLFEHEGNLSKVARSLQTPVTTLVSRCKGFDQKIKEMSDFLNA